MTKILKFKTDDFAKQNGCSFNIIYTKIQDKQNEIIFYYKSSPTHDEERDRLFGLIRRYTTSTVACLD